MKGRGLVKWNFLRGGDPGEGDYVMKDYLERGDFLGELGRGQSVRKSSSLRLRRGLPWRGSSYLS